ncbi:hypothetical protein KI387_020184, partial [Taxus chinensis]
MAEKLNALEQQRLEEEEIKRLRKEMILCAQPMPFFYHTFIPRRSSKSPTIPKEPRFHVPHHKRAKCISSTPFEYCRDQPFFSYPYKRMFQTDVVMRVSLGSFLFFTIFSLVMIGIKTQKDIRNGWHHAGWIVKIICW